MKTLELGIYVAGPLYSSSDLTTNTRAAIDAAQKLEQAKLFGVVLRPFVPHVLVQTWQLVYARDHVVAQDWDDFWLRKCDALLRLPGFSVGTDHEVGICYALGTPVFQHVDSLLCWAQSCVSY